MNELADLVVPRKGEKTTQQVFVVSKYGEEMNERRKVKSSGQRTEGKKASRGQRSKGSEGTGCGARGEKISVTHPKIHLEPWLSLFNPFGSLSISFGFSLLNMFATSTPFA